MKLTTTSRGARRLAAPLVLTGVVALGVAGCAQGVDGENAEAAGSSVSPTATASARAKAAATALDAGLQAHAAGDLTTAAEKYGEVLHVDPTNKFGFYNLALIDEAHSNYGLAQEKYRKAIESDPAYEPALFNLAILVTSSDPKEAVTLYQRAVKADEKDASAWMNLGLLLRSSGDEAAGNKAVRTAVALNPDLTDPAS